MKAIWDVRWEPTEEGQHFHDNKHTYYGRWVVYCTVHGEVYASILKGEEAQATCDGLNQNEGGVLKRTKHAVDHLDMPFTYDEVWCHGGTTSGFHVAGWYQDDAWVRKNFRCVGERLRREDT